jgi:hypothetical protein
MNLGAFGSPTPEWLPTTRALARLLFLSRAASVPLKSRFAILKLAEVSTIIFPNQSLGPPTRR